MKEIIGFRTQKLCLFNFFISILQMNIFSSSFLRNLSRSGSIPNMALASQPSNTVNSNICIVNHAILASDVTSFN